VIHANGVGDRVTVIRGLSADVRLPERCDVLVAELIGNDPLAEGIVEVTRDARRRFLKPHARLVPSGLSVYGVPVTLPHRDRDCRVLGHDRLQRWHEWYGIDFTPLEDAWGDDAFIQYVASGLARTWTALGPPALLARYELEALGRPRIGGASRMTITQAGPLEALILYFELRSAATTFLSTAPTTADDDNHWLVPVRILSAPVDVTTGDRMTVRYRPGAIALV
jgi:hypothetical protein